MKSVDPFFDEYNRCMELNDRLKLKRPLEYNIGRIRGIKAYMKAKKDADGFIDLDEYRIIMRLRVPKLC